LTKEPKTYIREKTASSTNGIERTTSTCRIPSNVAQCYIPSSHGNHYKWVKDLNIRPETLLVLQENSGIGLVNYFLNRTPIAHKIIARIEKWECIKLNASAYERKLARIKRKPTEYEKIFCKLFIVQRIYIQDT
jgi:hypothetical protein